MHPAKSNPSPHHAPSVRVSTALATLLAALVLLPLLGAKPLTDWDEAIYAGVAREMLGHSWLIPHWNFQPWFEKPPLFMWITATLFKLFGVNAFTARATSALSGIATIALLHSWLARTRGTLTAWLSTAILLTTFEFLHACHTGETDTLLALACCISVLGLTRIDDLHPRSWYLFWTGFAIALMTKGAASVVIPLTAIVLGLLKPWRPRYLRAPFWLGLVLFLLLTLPWHLYLISLYGHAFLSEYLGLHVLARATHQIEGHATPWWFYFKVLLVAAPPFVFLYPSAIAGALRTRDPNLHRSPDLRAFAIFPLVVLGFYTCIQTRLPQYIVPACPALSVVTAVWLSDRLRPLLSPRRPATFWVKTALIAATVSIATLLATTPARKALHSTHLANGAILPDNKDSITLLRTAAAQARLQMQPDTDPLLLWRRQQISSIAADLFYARRRIQQVQLSPPPPDAPINRYNFNPIPLDQAVTPQPRLILLDRALVPQIPPRFAYTPIQSQGEVELGSIVRAP